MTTITRHPEPAPPPGAQPDAWEHFDDDEMYRVVLGPLMSVAGRSEVTVQSSAIQFDDGGICTSDAVIEAPKVYIASDSDRGLTAEQARELARYLIQAAAIAESWTGGGGADSRLATAKAAVMDAYVAFRRLPGNAADYLRAALDSVTDAEAVTR